MLQELYSFTSASLGLLVGNDAWLACLYNFQEAKVMVPYSGMVHPCPMRRTHRSIPKLRSVLGVLRRFLYLMNYASSSSQLFFGSEGPRGCMMSFLIFLHLIYYRFGGVVSTGAGHLSPWMFPGHCSRDIYPIVTNFTCIDQNSCTIWALSLRSCSALWPTWIVRNNITRGPSRDTMRGIIIQGPVFDTMRRDEKRAKPAT